MNRLKTYKQHVDEMAQITRKGKKVYADDKLLKDVTAEELDDENIAFVYMDKNNFFFSQGKFWFYFVSDPKWVEDFQEGKSGLLLFPIRHAGNAFHVSPIKDVWKKSHNRDVPNADLIIGIVEGFFDEKTNQVYIEMMSTRPGYKRNTINKKLIEAIHKHTPKFKDATIIWEDPTADGLDFIKHYSGDEANFRFTIGHREKKFKEYYPELAAEDEALRKTGRKVIHVGPDITRQPGEEE